MRSNTPSLRECGVAMTDFGLARSSIETGEQLTMHKVVGTPACMAPEQVLAISWPAATRP